MDTNEVHYERYVMDGLLECLENFQSDPSDPFNSEVLIAQYAELKSCAMESRGLVDGVPALLARAEDAITRMSLPDVQNVMDTYSADELGDLYFRVEDFLRDHADDGDPIDLASVVDDFTYRVKLKRFVVSELAVRGVSVSADVVSKMDELETAFRTLNIPA